MALLSLMTKKPKDQDFEKRVSRRLETKTQVLRTTTVRLTTDITDSFTFCLAHTVLYWG